MLQPPSLGSCSVKLLLAAFSGLSLSSGGWVEVFVCYSCSLTISCFLFQKTDLTQEPKVSGTMQELVHLSFLRPRLLRTRLFPGFGVYYLQFSFPGGFVHP